jgi:hypothetical protein
MKNLFLLPTDKPSVLIKDFNNKFLLTNGDIQSLRDGYQFKHIYITNDEEIKEGDWVIKISSLYKGGGIAQKYSFIDAQFEDIIFKKIILTTDQDLIKDGVQAIDDEFLEWFVNNPSCESVEIQKAYKHFTSELYDYKIIIPQEDPKKETLEKAAENYSRITLNKNGLMSDKQVNGFIAGVKWQAEKIPSIIEQYLETAFISKEQGYKNPKDWFEQFEKKS